VAFGIEHLALEVRHNFSAKNREIGYMLVLVLVLVLVGYLGN